MEHRVSASDGTIIIDTAALIPRETPELRQLGDVGGDAPRFVAGGFRGRRDAYCEKRAAAPLSAKENTSGRIPHRGEQAAPRTRHAISPTRVSGPASALTTSYSASQLAHLKSWTRVDLAM